MVGAAVAAAPRYAPADPTLPPPWRALVDGNTGYIYYWDPETNITQYDKPLPLVAAGPPLPSGPPPASVISGQKLANGADQLNGGSGNGHMVGLNGFHGAVAMPSQQPKLAAIPVPRGAQAPVNQAVSIAANNSMPGSSAGMVMGVLPGGQKHGGNAYDNASRDGYFKCPRVEAMPKHLTADIDSYRKQHEVTAMGENVPAPFMSFEAVGFPPDMLREIRSRDLELDKEEGGGEVQLTAAAPVSQEADDSDFQSPPTTPKSTISSPFLECPSTPLLKRKQLSRQQSLRDTKLLLTTHLKRTASIFMFDKHFEYLREIGHGSFSTVYEARDRKGGALCAVKMSKREFFSRVDRDRYMREIQSVACLAEHPNVVNYFRGWQQDSHFYIQMELCEAGNLRMLLDSLKQPLDEHQVWEYIEDVASGLSHIHKHGVLHLDIKPDNIFIDGQGNLKIGDFGLAVPCKLWDWEEGDGGYLAPELLQEEDPSPKADIYSFGAMAFEWVTGVQLPRTRPVGEDILQMPSWRSEALGSLVRAMLHPDPVKRPNADQILLYKKSRA